MQASQTGRLNINVTDGGLLELAGETYMLTCRDNPNTYQSPELHFKVVDSTVRVLNSRSLRFGRDDTTKNTATPVFSRPGLSRSRITARRSRKAFTRFSPRRGSRLPTLQNSIRPRMGCRMRGPLWTILSSSMSVM